MINNRFNRAKQAFYNGDGNNVNTQKPNIPNNIKSMQKRLQRISFALVELVLYLDAYPNCRKALAYYHSLLDMKKKLTAEYQAQYGPITAFGNDSRSEWNWTKTPWPWEMN